MEDSRGLNAFVSWVTYARAAYFDGRAADVGSDEGTPGTKAY
jgi:hypothetical protein